MVARHIATPACTYATGQWSRQACRPANFWEGCHPDSREASGWLCSESPVCGADPPPLSPKWSRGGRLSLRSRATRRQSTPTSTSRGSSLTSRAIVHPLRLLFNVSPGFLDRLFLDGCARKVLYWLFPSCAVHLLCESLCESRFDAQLYRWNISHRAMRNRVPCCMRLFDNIFLIFNMHVSFDSLLKHHVIVAQLVGSCL